MSGTGGTAGGAGGAVFTTLTTVPLCVARHQPRAEHEDREQREEPHAAAAPGRGRRPDRERPRAERLSDECGGLLARGRVVLGRSLSRDAFRARARAGAERRGARGGRGRDAGLRDRPEELRRRLAPGRRADGRPATAAELLPLVQLRAAVWTTLTHKSVGSRQMAAGSALRVSALQI
jgi:hypothetical protein